MQVKLIDHGCPDKYLPRRAHANDVGLDVYAIEEVIIPAFGATVTGLGFGIECPIGYGAFLFPRTSMAKEALDVKLCPIDPGYTGEVHVILTNNGGWKIFYPGERIGQLVFLPVATPELVKDLGPERGTGAFGSTGR